MVTVSQVMLPAGVQLPTGTGVHSSVMASHDRSCDVLCWTREVWMFSCDVLRLTWKVLSKFCDVLSVVCVCERCH